MKERKGKGENRLTHRVHTRITKKKYEELSALLEQSTGLRSLSGLLRSILEKGKFTLVKRHPGPDKLLEELTLISKEINAIGVNINQVMRYFHREDLPQSKLIHALDIIKLFQQADLKLTETITVISKIAAQW